jgi:tRNA (cmo5U34)-methyltransferase
MTKSDNTTPYTAAEYDDNVKKTIPFYGQMHTQTIDMVKTIKPHFRLWLDTGCGTGFLVEQALNIFPIGRFVLADPSEEMLQVARERLQTYPNERVCFVPLRTCEALAASLPQRPDIITAIMCHHYMNMEQRHQATQVCFDLLAEGGLYVTFENVRPGSAEAIKLGLQRWHRFQLSQGRTKEAADEHMARFDTAYFPITVQEHLGILRDCGFRMSELFWYSYMQAGFYAVKANSKG